MLADLQLRSYPLELSVRADDPTGLTVTGLVVPYGVPADVREIRDGRPFEYREQFAAGAFERAVRVPYRVGLMFGHSDAFDARLGFATAFDDTAAGLVGTFRLDPSRAEHARDVLASSHGSLSAAFLSLVPRPHTERAGDLVVRRSVHLAHVAACEEPVYADARVLAMRSVDDAENGEPTVNEVAHAALLRSQAEFAEWLESTKREQAELMTRVAPAR